MHRSFGWSGVVALALVALTGCPRNLVGGAPEEAVRIEDVRARFTPGEQGAFEVDFSVENPGFQAGAITSIQWEVWLGSRWFAAGTQQLDVPLPNEGRQAFTVTLPVVFRRTTPADEVPVTLELGLRGGLVVQNAGGNQRLPFQTRRQVQALHAPELEQEEAY